MFTNLVDFDSEYGHRNDPGGYAACVEAFDRRLPDLRAALDGGMMFVTGDHGCDPTTPPTDHSRETTPLLAAGVPRGPHDLGVRPAEPAIHPSARRVARPCTCGSRARLIDRARPLIR